MIVNKDKKPVYQARFRSSSGSTTNEEKLMSGVFNGFLIKIGPHLANQFHVLAHWGRVTHICVGNLTIIGSDNGLSPNRYQAIIWTNAGILLIGPLRTNFSEILIEIITFSFKKAYSSFESVVCETAEILPRPQCVNTLRPRQNGRHFQTTLTIFQHWSR